MSKGTHDVTTKSDQRTRNGYLVSELRHLASFSPVIMCLLLSVCATVKRKFSTTTATYGATLGVML